MTATTGVRAATPRVTVLDAEQAPADPEALAHLRAGLCDADLAAPAVVLPDFHQKSNMEMPSSIAVATEGTIRPTLTSASVNCGMALVSLDVDRPSERAIADFYLQVLRSHPFPPSYRRDLTVQEVIRCAAEGARFAGPRFGVDDRDLDGFEEGGTVDVDRYGGVERVRRELPLSVKHLARIRFGTIGPSNHFVELQEVEEILDPPTAALLGLEQGQITMQFHGGGGSLPGELGLLYGRRKRYPRPVRVQMAVQKPLYHLATARSAEQLRLRRRLYFSRDYPPVERDGPEGERLLLANAMAMNYGFAFRIAAYAWLSQLLGRCFASGARLVVDSPHNSIYEEEVDGRPAIVHRHNAARVYPAERVRDHPIFGTTGRPLLLPGTNQTSSYVCIPGERPERSLHSACHGAGSTIKSYVARGLSRPDPRGRITRRFDYAGGGPSKVEQLDDRAVDAALGILVDNLILRPVARLRPFAVLN